MATYILAKVINHEETWKYTDGSRCSLKKKKVNDNIMLDEKLRHIQVFLNYRTHGVIIYFQGNPPKGAQSAHNDVEAVEYRRLHHL